jgi:hypothetical protein
MTEKAHDEPKQKYLFNGHIPVTHSGITARFKLLDRTQEYLKLFSLNHDQRDCYFKACISI